MTRIGLALFALVALAIFPAAHCNPGPAWNAFVDCETAAVKDDLPGILPLVADIVLSKGTDAAADAALAGLALKFGVDSVECAVVAVVVALSPAPSTQPAKVMIAASPNDAARGRARAEVWLKTHGVTVKARP